MKAFSLPTGVMAGVARTLDRAATNPWIAPLARCGYAVRGVLYGTVAVLALQLALGHGGATSDKTGALAAIGVQPFGKGLLVLMAVGLVGYSLWGFVRALLDPLQRGTEPKGLAQRVGYFVSGLSYGGLVLPTLRLIFGAGGGGGNVSADWSAKLLSLPFGPWLVGLIGLIVMAGGLGQMYQAVSSSFQKDFEAWDMRPAVYAWASWIARVGLVARGIVFMMLGYFLIQAARSVDPRRAQGLDGALQTLAGQPHGPWLLGGVALGLLAFGLYSLVCARWIRIRISPI